MSLRNWAKFWRYLEFFLENYILHEISDLLYIVNWDFTAVFEAKFVCYFEE